MRNCSLVHICFAVSIVVTLLLVAPAARAGEPGESRLAEGCEQYALAQPTEQEMADAHFHPGGIKAFLIAFLAGPRIGLEYNEGRRVRGIEYWRAVPYLGNLVGLYLCTEALAGDRMTAVAAETEIDEWRRNLYFARIHALEDNGDFAEAARMRECSPFDTFNHPPNPAAVKPDERRGFAKWKSGVSGLLIDNRVGLEREESRGIRSIEYWSLLYIPRIFPAINAYKGRTMSEVVRKEHLDEAWLDRDREKSSRALEPGGRQQDLAGKAQPFVGRSHASSHTSSWRSRREARAVGRRG